VISEGAGGDMVSQYRFVVYYHEDKPKWFETVKVLHLCYLFPLPHLPHLPQVCIPIDDFYGSHLKFTFKHKSSNEGLH
jgi:dedicator of cytokinesis protein 1